MSQSPKRRFQRLPMVIAITGAALTADFAAAQLGKV